MEDQSNKDTILTEEASLPGSTIEEPLLQQPASKTSKRAVVIGIAIFVVTVIIMIIVISKGSGDTIPEGAPYLIRLALPNETTIELGDSRVVEVIFYSGKDDRTSGDYKAVTKRNITWSTYPAGIIAVDPYGRIQTLALGSTSLRVESADNQSAFATATLAVIEKSQAIKIGTKKRIINYKGTKTRPSNLAQKTVTKKMSEEVLGDPEVPLSLKQFLSGNSQSAGPTRSVRQGDILWEIKDYSDGSNRSYLLRTNTTAPEGDRNKYQYFMGNRYLPGPGTSVVHIDEDGNSGVWTTDKDNQVTHISFAMLNTTSKAFKMVKDYEPYLRYGLASGTNKQGDAWVAGISDNDGLWTSMYAAGQLMRYSAVKQMGYSDQTVAESRTSALRSLKAVLMISNVASRNTTVDARIRHFNNTRTGDGARMSREFLKKGRVYSVDNFNGNSMAGVGFFGNDAGKTIDNLSYGGKQVYTYLPNQPDDWSTNTSADAPATSKRSIKGFISRSFGIYGVDALPGGGLFFKHNPDGTQTVILDAQRLYDFEKGETPTLDLGNLPLPEVLLDIINLKGVQYNKSNLFYKGDTSTDEVVGHIFIYKIAFDILDDNDPEERTLKQLIAKTMVDFCTGLIDNGYSFVDATGQGTTWGKMVRDFMNSDFSIEDAPVKTIEMLMSFKVCAYVTGDDRWEKEYQYMIQDPAFRYLDVVAGVWKRWVWRSFNEDYNFNPFEGKLDSSQQYTQQEVIRHVMMEIHYSDEEEALLAYYLAFQLEDNPEYLAKYREGLEGWWQSISRSENPIWYLIYQLAYPNEVIKDHFGSNILDASMWQLERHPISTIKYVSYIEGSRPDIVCQGTDPPISVDPTKIIQKRKHQSDGQYAERPLNKKTVASYDPLNLYEIKVLPKDERNMDKFNAATFEHPFSGSPNSMEPPTTYTLPYWLGVYHKMIDPQ